MSWCRWGWKCGEASWVPSAEDLACIDCPGSALYIISHVDGDFACYSCALNGGDKFRAPTENAMFAHILEHDAAGHHVLRSLLEKARRAKR